MNAHAYGPPNGRAYPPIHIERYNPGYTNESVEGMKEELITDKKSGAVLRGNEREETANHRDYRPLERMQERGFDDFSEA